MNLCGRWICSPRSVFTVLLRRVVWVVPLVYSHCLFKLAFYTVLLHSFVTVSHCSLEILSCPSTQVPSLPMSVLYSPILSSSSAQDYSMTKDPDTKGKIIFAVCLVVCLSVALMTGFVLHFKGGGGKVTTTEAATKAPARQTGNRTDVIVDCHPEPGATEESCKERECLWLPNSERGAHWCIFPCGYGYQVVGEASDTPLGMRIELQRTSHAPYLTESLAIDRIYLDVEYHSDARLRLRFYPTNGTRWEIPDSVLNITSPHTASDEMKRLYNVTLVTAPTFGITVCRKSSGAVVFDTSLPGFLYTDQYLQLTTRLSNDYIYGFGEHNHRRFRHDMNWKTWSIFTRYIWPIDAWNLYSAHPTYMNVEDDGAANMVFLKNSNAMEVALQPAPYPAVTFRTIGGVLDFYIFLGTSPGNAVEQYTEAVGRPVMPPYWTLGYHLCRWGYGNITDLKMVIDRNRAAGIPYDGQWVDLEYMYEKFVFSYDRRTYDGLPKLVDDLHNHHQKFVVIVDPGISSNRTGIESIKSNSPGYDIFDDGVKEGIFVKNPNNIGPIIAKVWPGPTVFPDFTDPKTEAWLEKWARYFRDKESIRYDSLWIDMNEPASFVPGSQNGCEKNKLNYPPYTPNILGRGDDGRMYDKTLCMDSQQHLGIHYDVHSLYAHTQVIQTYNALKRIFPGKRPWTMTRSSFAGSGKYATKWMGDNQATWDNMKWSIIGVLEFGLFGFSLNGADICGFWLVAEYEMCVRWHQLGAFYTFARNHNGRGDAPTIFTDQDPAAWDQHFILLTKEVLFTRYRLLPYFYTLMHFAHVRGDTVMRSLMFEFPKDHTARDVDEQFMLGPALLISPVLSKGQTTVHAYFPAARWYDYFGGKQIDAMGEHLELYTPLHKFNLHVRGGNVIPWQVPSTTTYESRQNKQGAIVALCTDGLANGDLFWDDGESIDTYETGTYLHVTFEMPKTGELHIRPVVSGHASAPPHLDTLEIYGLWTVPTSFYVDGVQLTNTNIRLVNKIVQLLDLNLDLAAPHYVTWTIY